MSLPWRGRWRVAAAAATTCRRGCIRRRRFRRPPTRQRVGHDRFYADLYLGLWYEAVDADERRAQVWSTPAAWSSFSSSLLEYSLFPSSVSTGACVDNPTCAQS